MGGALNHHEKDGHAMRIDAAPLQGITTYIYRCAHAELFGGADRYFMPFLSPAAEHLITEKEMRDLTPAHNRGVEAVPQVTKTRGPRPVAP
jgi:hypothetical protein